MRIPLSPFEQRWEARHRDDTFHGLRWHDMPGNDPDARKMNFFLLKRGIYDDDDDSSFKASKGTGPKLQRILAIIKSRRRYAPRAAALR